MDGVFADMDRELVRHADALFGDAPRSAPEPPAPPGDGAPSEATAEPGADPAAPELSPGAGLRLTSRQQRQLWRHIGTIENFWGTLEEIEPGITRRLAALASDRRWEIIFLTKRPSTAGESSQLQTQRWLEARGFPLPSVYVVQGSRGRIAAALGLDFVVDDRPENCLDVVVDSKARAILVWRADVAKAPAAANRLGIGIVPTLSRCLDILAEADAPDGDRPGVMERVRRLLGLKKTPADAPGAKAQA